MASASSLLGLVSQLQSLESSFAAILMEAAMKLANLTDANIFFLVETPQGRKFSGKRHLCDLYIGGELAPVGDDVEYEIDPTVSAIQEKYFGNAAEDGGSFDWFRRCLRVSLAHLVASIEVVLVVITN